MPRIIVTGSNSRFGKILKSYSNKNFIFKDKKQLNILSIKSIVRNLRKHKPTHILHLAGLSRPMKIHESNISKSIDLNIIGTCNLVKEASKKNIKLIHLSTSYVYPGSKGNYSEIDSLKPWNNYGWSKLGAESAVQMYKNSLIIRACMTEKPFVHKYAFNNVKCNFIFHDEFIKIFLKVLKFKGILNIGGKSQSIYSFAKKYNKRVKKKKSKGELPLNIYMSLKKVNQLIKK